MHFWINKGICSSSSRQARLQGANGRYVPPSLASGSRRKELRFGKPEMVTPVHRFLPMEGHGSASPTHHHHHHQHHSQQHRSARFPPITEEQHETPQPSTRLETQRRRRRRLPPSRPTSKDLVCVNLVKLLLLCLVIVSYYIFKYNISRMNNTVQQFGAIVPLTIIIVGVVILVKAMMKVCKEQSREAGRVVDANRSQSWSVDSSDEGPPPFADTQRIVSDVEAAAVRVAEETPPPPYSVAVMLPTRNERLQIIQDSPPPSYEKAIT